MSTNFPGGLDDTTVLKNNATDSTVTSITHETAHNNVADALIAVETALGLNPKGSYASVRAWLDDAIIKTPATAQVIRPSADVVAQTIRKHSGTDVSNMSEWHDHLDAVIAYVEPTGILSTQGFRVAGTLLNSTHLSDSALLARLAGPTFTGTVIAPTPAVGDNSTKVATTAFVEARVTPAVRLALSGNLLIPSGAPSTTVTWDTEVFKLGDAAQHAGTNTERLTAKVAGVYLIKAEIVFNDTGSGNLRELDLYFNGTTHIGEVFSPPGYYFYTISSIYQFAVNDYVIIRVFHDAATSLQIVGGPGASVGSTFSFVKIA